MRGRFLHKAILSHLLVAVPPAVVLGVVVMRINEVALRSEAQLLHLSVANLLKESLADEVRLEVSLLGYAERILGMELDGDTKRAMLKAVVANGDLSHIAVFRDIHYTASMNPGRATEGNPLTLKEDEFFVLGDNSPASHDSRFWEEPGNSNGQAVYRQGIVPRDYLIGRALFVYWPGGYHISPKVRFGIIPNVGEMRFIY